MVSITFNNEFRSLIEVFYFRTFSDNRPWPKSIDEQTRLIRISAIQLKTDHLKEKVEADQIKLRVGFSFYVIDALKYLLLN